MALFWSWIKQTGNQLLGYFRGVTHSFKKMKVQILLEFGIQSPNSNWSNLLWFTLMAISLDWIKILRLLNQVSQSRIYRLATGYWFLFRSSLLVTFWAAHHRRNISIQVTYRTVSNVSKTENLVLEYKLHACRVNSKIHRFHQVQYFWPVNGVKILTYLSILLS